MSATAAARGSLFVLYGCGRDETLDLVGAIFRGFNTRRVGERSTRDPNAVTSRRGNGAGKTRAIVFVRILDRYILGQITTPLFAGTVVVTAIVWLTQSLQRLELVIDYGEGWGDFAWLTVLLIPSLLVVVIPFALFGAALFAVNKMLTDSEIAVMFAAGFSKLRIARSILLIAAIGAGVTLWLNLDLMPRSYRQLKTQVAELRADFASAVLRAGEFTSIGNAFTVYVEETLPGGRFRGVLIHDYRSSNDQVTYMAQQALLRATPAGPILYLSNGNRQTASDQTVDIIRFDQTAINIAAFGNGPRDLQLETTERYLGELLHPDLSKPWDRENASALIAEGHARLASPVYPFVYALIALYALLWGPYSRRGQGLRIVAACAAAGGLRIAAFVVQSAAAATGVYWPIYALPAVPCIVLLVLLSDVVRMAPGSSPRPAQNEDVQASAPKIVGGEAR